MKKYIEPELNMFYLEDEVILIVSGGDTNANEGGQSGTWGDFWTTP